MSSFLFGSSHSTKFEALFLTQALKPPNYSKQTVAVFPVICLFVSGLVNYYNCTSGKRLQEKSKSKMLSAQDFHVRISCQILYVTGFSPRCPEPTASR